MIIVLGIPEQEDFHPSEIPLEKTREIDNESGISKKAEMKRKFYRNQTCITPWYIHLSCLTSLVISNVCLQYFVTKSSGFMHFLPIISCHRIFVNITVLDQIHDTLDQIPCRLNWFVSEFGTHSIMMWHDDFVGRCRQFWFIWSFLDL